MYKMTGNARLWQVQMRGETVGWCALFWYPVSKLSYIESTNKTKCRSLVRETEFHKQEFYALLGVLNGGKTLVRMPLNRFYK